MGKEEKSCFVNNIPILYSLSGWTWYKDYSFFQRLSVKCLWCSNPESQSVKPEIIVTKRKCIGCRTCVKVCPRGAITVMQEGPEIERGTYDMCMQCANNCPSNALEVVGQEMDAFTGL